MCIITVCGTTGKRKACKDCSCGLAEELKAEAGGLANKIDNPIQKSSCGSVSNTLFKSVSNVILLLLNYYSVTWVMHSVVLHVHI